METLVFIYLYLYYIYIYLICHYEISTVNTDKTFNIILLCCEINTYTEYTENQCYCEKKQDEVTFHNNELSFKMILDYFTVSGSHVSF